MGCTGGVDFVSQDQIYPLTVQVRVQPTKKTMAKPKLEAIKLIDAKEVGRLLSMSPKTIHDNHMKMGLIPVEMIPGQQRRLLRWPEDEVIAYQHQRMDARG